MHQNDELAQGTVAGFSPPRRTSEDHSLIGPQEYPHLCSVSAQQAESTSLDVELQLIQPYRRLGRESTNFVLSCRNSQGLSSGRSKQNQEGPVDLYDQNISSRNTSALAFFSLSLYWDVI